MGLKDARDAAIITYAAIEVIIRTATGNYKEDDQLTEVQQSQAEERMQEGPQSSAELRNYDRDRAGEYRSRSQCPRRDEIDDDDPRPPSMRARGGRRNRNPYPD